MVIDRGYSVSNCCDIWRRSSIGHWRPDIARLGDGDGMGNCDWRGVCTSHHFVLCVKGKCWRVLVTSRSRQTQDSTDRRESRELHDVVIKS